MQVNSVAHRGSPKPLSKPFHHVFVPPVMDQAGHPVLAMVHPSLVARACVGAGNWGYTIRANTAVFPV
eukprot:4057937-Prorocentrum_lima.AAC.1